MATNDTGSPFNLPFPRSTDPVNVHGDIQALASRLKDILPPLGISAFQISVINDSGETLPAGTPVYATNFTTVTNVDKCLPTTPYPILGLLKQELEDGEQGICVVAGVMENINTSGFDNGDVLYVGTEGGLSNLATHGAVGIVAHAATDGIIIVEAKGNGTWGALKAGLA
jgi:hypothetical protein